MVKIRRCEIALDVRLWLKKAKEERKRESKVYGFSYSASTPTFIIFLLVVVGSSHSKYYIIFSSKRVVQWV